MQVVVKLWDRPQLAKSYRQYQGMSTIELIEKEPQVVIWHVRNHSWQLSEDAKAQMPKAFKKNHRFCSSKKSF